MGEFVVRRYIKDTFVSIFDRLSRLFPNNMSRPTEQISSATQKSSPIETKAEIFTLEDIAHNSTAAAGTDEDDIIAQKRKAVEEGQNVQLKSQFDTLTTLKALSVFRKTAFICAIAGFAAATDGMPSVLSRALHARAYKALGYQHQLSANVIANQGFIEKFRPAGELELDPSHVSVFGGVYRYVSTGPW